MIELLMTDNEIIIFLTKNGWVVSEGDIVYAEFIHGSKIEYEDQNEVFAEKNGEKLSLYRAFEKELKNKILQL